MFGKRIKYLRNEKALRQEDVAKKLGIARTTYAMYEQGKREPDFNLLEKMAELYDVSVDYLLGRTDDPSPLAKKGDSLPELTEKEEQDIAKDLERMLKALDADNGYASFDGRDIEEMDEEDKELLKASLENSLRLAKRIAKQKFTPKKYKK